ncbi:Hypothetical protein SRAE_2000288400 [Strongyloides ratti]|uniref:Uncharacterized protein n=1 Tax=Strongyloides ratti TaxID=34506 RepID=A0A090LEP3_STRRB|nr:Hypothetical protein SRAE_2000288400 [Strongyloides ratti]CEF68226.1 Hypothetical protein SRAE_2000288400 [Strongyloides ratti]
MDYSVTDDANNILTNNDNAIDSSESSIILNSHSFNLLQNQDFCDLAFTPEIEKKYNWRGRKLDNTREPTTFCFNNASLTGIKKRKKGNISKRSSLPCTFEEESSNQTKSHSLRLSQNQDFIELACSTINSRKSKSHDRTLNTTHKSTVSTNSNVFPTHTKNKRNIYSSQEVEESNQKKINRYKKTNVMKRIINKNDHTPKRSNGTISQSFNKFDDSFNVSIILSPKSFTSKRHSKFPTFTNKNISNHKNISKITVDHVLVKGKKRQHKDVAVRKSKVSKPNEDQIQILNVRRSRRNRIPPVDDLLLQKPIYERDENGLLTLVGVSEVVVKDPLFIKYGTTDFEKIKHMKAVQNKIKRQEKKENDQNIAY